MASSCSRIADALVSMLSGSTYFPNAVSKLGYEKLESSGSAAIMVKWRDISMEKTSFDMFAQAYNYEIKCFIRDEGNPQLTTNRVWVATEKIINCLDSDHSLQNTCDDIDRISAFQNPEEAVLIGNNITWIPINFRITAKVYN